MATPIEAACAALAAAIQQQLGAGNTQGHVTTTPVEGRGPLTADQLYADAVGLGAPAAALKAYAADYAQLSGSYTLAQLDEPTLTAAFNAALAVIKQVTNGDTSGPAVSVASRLATEAKAAFVAQQPKAAGA